MSILFGLLLARRFYCRSALSLSPGRTGGLLPRINAPKRADCTFESASAFIVLTTHYLLFLLERKDFITFDITE